MTEEKKESRLKVEDLPQAEEELTAEEAKKVQGGVLIGLLLPAVQKVGINAADGSVKPGDGSVTPQSKTLTNGS